MRLSTAFRNQLMVSAPAKELLDGSVVRLYAGTVPPDADAALPPDAVLLCEYTAGGDGTPLLMSADASNGTLFKDDSQVWRGDASETGPARFFRMVKPNDTGNNSTSAIRVQGTAGVGNVDLQTASETINAGSVQRINFFYLSLPASA